MSKDLMVLWTGSVDAVLRAVLLDFIGGSIVFPPNN